MTDYDRAVRNVGRCVNDFWPNSHGRGVNRAWPMCHLAEPSVYQSPPYFVYYLPEVRYALHLLELSHNIQSGSVTRKTRIHDAILTLHDIISFLQSLSIIIPYNVFLVVCRHLSVRNFYFHIYLHYIHIWQYLVTPGIRITNILVFTREQMCTHFW